MVESAVVKIKQVCSKSLIPRLISNNIYSVEWRFDKLSSRTERRRLKSTCASRSVIKIENEKSQRNIDRGSGLNPPVPELFNRNITQNSNKFLASYIQLNIETYFENCKRIPKRILRIISNINPTIVLPTYKTDLNINIEENLLKNRYTAYETVECFVLNIKQITPALFTPQLPTEINSHSEKCQRIINQIFDDDNKISFEVGANPDKKQLPYKETVKATTTTDNEEKLKQKIEKIDKSPLIESSKQEIENLNINPKMLGRRKKNWQLPKSENKTLLCEKKSSNYNGPSFDDIAKRCLESQTNQIDEQLLIEMGKVGLLSSGSLQRNVKNNEFLQAEVMKGPRRPVETPELDLIAGKKNVYERLEIKPPPSYNIFIEKSYNNTLLKTSNDIINTKGTLNSFHSNQKDDQVEENNQPNVNQNADIKVIRKLLQTRTEHLTKDKVKSYYLRNEIEQEKDPETSLKLKRVTFNHQKNIAHTNEVLNIDGRQPHIQNTDTVKTLNIQSEDEFLHPRLYYSNLKYSEQTLNSLLSQYSSEVGKQEDSSEETISLIKNVKQYKAEEPILAVETSRLQTYDSQIVEFLANNGLENSYSSEVLKAAKLVHPENIVSPLLDKGTIINVVNKNIEAEAPTLEMSNIKINNEETLSELLWRIRERNKEEYCREIKTKMHERVQVKPVIGKCGKKPPSCPPPAPTCPKPKKPICPPQKSKCPNPCPDPCNPKCPKPCPAPSDKNPCKKCCSYDKIYDAFTLLSYLGPQYFVAKKNMMPIFACATNWICNIDTSRSNSSNIVNYFQDQENALEAAIDASAHVAYSKSYEPWTPIPSLPFPEKKTTKKLVCPKDGCKANPPKYNQPCSSLNPCTHLPKPNSRSKR
ncbi:hypothetical protein ACJJTC_002690 [Scirpophaga incertulas]